MPAHWIRDSADYRASPAATQCTTLTHPAIPPPCATPHHLRPSARRDSYIPLRRGGTARHLRPGAASAPIAAPDDGTLDAIRRLCVPEADARAQHGMFPTVSVDSRKITDDARMGFSSSRGRGRRRTRRCYRPWSHAHVPVRTRPSSQRAHGSAPDPAPGCCSTAPSCPVAPTVAPLSFCSGRRPVTSRRSSLWPMGSRSANAR
jgi:hypothetical protein